MLENFVYGMYNSHRAAGADEGATPARWGRQMRTTK